LPVGDIGYSLATHIVLSCHKDCCLLFVMILLALKLGSWNLFLFMC